VVVLAHTGGCILHTQRQPDLIDSSYVWAKPEQISKCNDVADEYATSYFHEPGCDLEWIRSPVTSALTIAIHVRNHVGAPPDHTLVQCRREKIDLTAATPAREVLGDYVPQIEFLENHTLRLSDGTRTLYTYSSQYVNSLPLGEVLENLEVRARAIQDFAGLLSVKASPPPESIQNVINTFFAGFPGFLDRNQKLLEQQSFYQGIKGCFEDLVQYKESLLIYPELMIHPDPDRYNIIVNPSTGEIMTLIDWEAGSSFCPLGMDFGLIDYFFSAPMDQEKNAPWTAQVRDKLLTDFFNALFVKMRKFLRTFKLIDVQVYVTHNRLLNFYFLEQTEIEEGGDGLNIADAYYIKELLRSLNRSPLATNDNSKSSLGVLGGTFPYQ